MGMLFVGLELGEGYLMDVFGKGNEVTIKIMRSRVDLYPNIPAARYVGPNPVLSVLESLRIPGRNLGGLPALSTPLFTYRVECWVIAVGNLKGDLKI